MIIDKLAFLLPEISLIVLSLGLLTNSMTTYSGRRIVNKVDCRSNAVSFVYI